MIPTCYDDVFFFKSTPQNSMEIPGSHLKNGTVGSLTVGEESHVSKYMAIWIGGMDKLFKLWCKFFHIPTFSH